MNNYVLEGQINFTNELMKLICEDAKEESETQDYCLISGEILSKNFVVLKCGHKFNYDSILNETKNQRKINNLEVQRVGKTQIKCPYCRTIHDGILPWYDGYDKIKNVNWSKGNKKIYKSCIAILNSGKRKGEACGCKAKLGDYCGRHKKLNGIEV
jgi:hypothetical protein